MREALFSVLAARVRDARVLDLYAGSGALGIEALSRGALHATFVEHARPALEALRANLVELGLEDATVVCAGAVAQSGAVVAPHGPYDLVFADPPYADVARGAAVAALERVLRVSGMLTPGAWLVLEHAARDPAPVLPIPAIETRRYGDTAVSLYCADPALTGPTTETDPPGSAREDGGPEAGQSRTAGASAPA